MKPKYFPVFIILLLLVQNCLAQQGQDSNYIRPFTKSNDLEWYTGRYNTVFNFKPNNNDSYLRHHNLKANTSAYIGMHIDYKWLAVDVSTSLPRTFVDNNIKGRKAHSLQLSKTGSKLRIEGLYEKYNALVIPLSRRHQEYQVFNNFGYSNYSAQLTYIFNSNRFSLPAAINYGERQVKSAGSFLFNFNPTIHQFAQNNNPGLKLTPSDSLLNHAISNHSGWMNTFFNGGYTHNFVWNKGRWSLNPWIMGGLGVQKELADETKNSGKLTYNFRGMISSGYNGTLFYIYLNTLYNKTESRLPASKLTVRNSDTYLTMGYRFGNSPHKIMGLL
jgi:hypothetical protein